MNAIVIDTLRTAYCAEDVEDTMTVAELIETLSTFNPDAKVLTSHDCGYSYGGIKYLDIAEYNHNTYPEIL